MKRIALLSIIAICITLNISAQKFKQNGISYEIVDGYARINDIDKALKKIVITEFVSYKGKQYEVWGVKLDKAPVIKKPVFKDVGIETIEFEDGCTQVMPRLCSGMDGLRNVMLSRGIWRINEDAFRDCRNLKTITLPDSLIQIGSFAFHNCKSLERIVIPDGVKRIESYAFSGCENLQEIVIPASVDSMGINIFQDCSLLKKVIFSGNLRIINDGMFRGCKKLQSIVLPADAIKIGKEVFRGCVSLSNILLPNAAQYLSDEDAAKDNNYGLVYKGTFFGCSALSNIKCHDGHIPDNIMKYIPFNCPFAENGGSPINPNFETELLANNKLSDGENRKLVIQSSDVDVAIPQTGKDKHPETYAIVIGNKPKDNYSTFAEHDALVFAEYCHKTLGLPDNNIQTLIGASYAEMLKEVKVVHEVTKAFKGNVRIIFYFSGECITDEETGAPFLLPADEDGSVIELCYSVEKLFTDLALGNPKEVFVFLETGIGMNLKPQGNTVAFVASDKTLGACQYKEKFHGLFSYFLLKKLQNSKGDCILEELDNYIHVNVNQYSNNQTGISQKSLLVPSENIKDRWKTMKLK